MRILAAALAGLALSATSAAGQTPRLPIVEIAPRFTDGVHSGCDLRFVNRMGLSSGFQDNLAGGSVAVWFADNEVSVFLKLGFTPRGGQPAAPATAYLVQGFQTNFADLAGSMVEEGYLVSLFNPDADTLSMIIGQDDEDRTTTVGYTKDNDMSYTFDVVLSREQQVQWQECVGAIFTRWLAVPEPS